MSEQNTNEGAASAAKKTSAALVKLFEGNPEVTVLPPAEGDFRFAVTFNQSGQKCTVSISPNRFTKAKLWSEIFWFGEKVECFTLDELQATLSSASEHYTKTGEFLLSNDDY